MMNILCIGLVEILAAVTLQVYFHLFHQFGTIHSVYHLSLYSRQRGFCLRGFGSGSAALLHLTYAIHPLYAPYVDMIIAYHFDKIQCESLTETLNRSHKMAAKLRVDAYYRYGI